MRVRAAMQLGVNAVQPLLDLSLRQAPVKADFFTEQAMCQQAQQMLVSRADWVERRVGRMPFVRGR